MFFFLGCFVSVNSVLSYTALFVLILLCSSRYVCNQRKFVIPCLFPKYGNKRFSSLLSLPKLLEFGLWFDDPDLPSEFVLRFGRNDRLCLFDDSDSPSEFVIRFGRNDRLCLFGPNDDDSDAAVRIRCGRNDRFCSFGLNKRIDFVWSKPLDAGDDFLCLWRWVYAAGVGCEPRRSLVALVVAVSCACPVGWVRVASRFRSRCRFPDRRVEVDRSDAFRVNLGLLRR